MGQIGAPESADSIVKRRAFRAAFLSLVPSPPSSSLWAGGGGEEVVGHVREYVRRYVRGYVGECISEFV